ncbi:MAG: fibronectin/fibrinogen-binding protein [Ruminococcaceae bacterium]|nr:fibronectin/fibrinogen-binding protein [Oscillospiraceae bacterium]
MSLDGALLHCVKQELTNLIGARVDKIYQPSREEIVLSLRQLNAADKSRKSLIFSANGGSARVNLTSAEFENPQSPPMFCMLLRKHLGGGRLVDIRQDGLERILYFDFECTNEIGDIVVNTVVSEIMGRHSNIIIVRDGRVVDSIKRVTDEVSSVRRVLPNIVYETPPRVERLNILETSSEDILRSLDGRTDRLAKALPDILEGISPIFARECAYYAADDADAPCNTLTEEQRGRVGEFLNKAKEALNVAAEFTMLTDETGKKKDFCFVDIGQYGSAMTVTKFDTANAMLDDFFSSAGRAERTRQRARDLLKTVVSAYERVSRKLELQKKELAECGEREVFRVCGDLINANIYQLEKGMTVCTLDDFYTGEQREIALDARLTPSQNAQKYYAEYRKLDTAEKKLTELIKKGADDLIYLDSVLDCISRNENEQELNEIRRELREQGFVRGGKDKPEDKKKRPSEPMKFRSTEGFEILVGKNNRQNDVLTLKTAKASDIWLHTKDIAGSHVIIKTDGKTPSERTIFEAAQLAAFHSKARSGSGVPVDYTAVKFVKKPAGAKPGMVIFKNNKTLYVTPSEEITDKLKTK